MSLARNVVLAFYQEAKKILFFVLLAWQNYSILRVNLIGSKYENLMEIISNLNVLIAG